MPDKTQGFNMRVMAYEEPQDGSFMTSSENFLSDLIDSIIAMAQLQSMQCVRYILARTFWWRNFI